MDPQRPDSEKSARGRWYLVVESALQICGGIGFVAAVTFASLAIMLSSGLFVTPLGHSDHFLRMHPAIVAGWVVMALVGWLARFRYPLLGTTVLIGGGIVMVIQLADRLF